MHSRPVVLFSFAFPYGFTMFFQFVDLSIKILCRYGLHYWVMFLLKLLNISSLNVAFILSYIAWTFRPRSLNLEMRPLRVRQQFRGPKRIEQISRSLDHGVPEALAWDCGSVTGKNSVCSCENQKLQLVTIKSLQHLSKCQLVSNGNVSWADNWDSARAF